MLYEILSRTPVWVWGVLALLVTLGASRLRTRHITLRRVLILPLVITGLSLFNTFSMFHGATVNGLLWAVAALLSGAWFSSAPVAPGTRYDSATGLFTIPGSWTPLVTMMAIFLLRYSSAVVLAIHPQWAHDPVVAAGMASLYGALSGLFIGRVGRMLRMMRQPAEASTRPVAQWG